MSDAAGQSSPANSSKPNVLIIGGLGYIGRFLAHHIHTNSLASTLRIVDKQLPQLALLSPEHLPACSEPNFLQADASRPQALPRIFDLPSSDQQFDYVFNCGGETRYSQEDEVYKARSHALSLNIGREAARRKVKAYIELSTAHVYEPKREPRRETDKTKPTSRQAKWKLQAEEDLARIPGLNLVVLRLAHVYGPYTGKWLGTQLALARVYQDLEKELKYLWSSDLRTNTVHVSDVVRACWSAAQWRSLNPSSTSGIFNIVDPGQTSQATMANIIQDLFKIDTGFQNTLINTFARLNLEHVVDDVNDETLDVWAELQQQAGIDAGSGPLTPFMEKELLKDVDLSVDGGRFVKVVGFRYEHPKITRQECEDVIESYKRMKWWP
ncbi:hypothetical protein KVT40_008579 [Elsinoe batatas]|uniref:NAD-dependent epimerase/dehydratase domain-containing protein n=1 Tax=Elsinoe batatas TaxID=2601811 RepID=A0A8K0L0K0_9PEZI|nr:hypothetical protein KVT40_008579 [Elsinoe batatas]